MSEYRLHCFAQSGNAYRNALMLELAGADWEPVFVDFFNGAARTPEYRAMNEMGEVPVLEHGDLRLSQSGVILDYLAGTLGKYGWKDEAERREILRWLLWDNHKLNSYIGPARFMMNFLAEDKRNPDIIAFLIGRARASLGRARRASEGSRLDRGRRDDHRGSELRGVSLLRDGVRNRHGRVSGGGPLAERDRGAARLEASL